MNSPPLSRAVQLLHRTIREQADRDPSAVAVVSGDRRLEYGQLVESALRLANVLRDVGVRPGDRVCLLAPKSPSAIIGILGTLCAGAVYVPLDSSSPASRIRKILANCDDRWILASGRVGSLLSEIVEDAPVPELVIGWLESNIDPALAVSPQFSWRDVASVPEASDLPGIDPSAPAYIMFTSGSTGVPKGVVITHANVHAFAAWLCRQFQLGPDDRLSGHPPLHFDLSTLDVYGALFSGASLHLVPSALNLVPQRLVEFIRKSELTQWNSVPSLLKFLAGYDVVRHNDFPALRRVLWCGEVFPTPHLMYWMQRLPHVTFANLYGPTETTCASSFYMLPECPSHESEAIPLGAPCDGEDLLVLDDDLQPVQPGQTGNLCISGVGLSPGYWKDAKRTREVFLEYRGADGVAGRLYKTGDLARIDEDSGHIYFVGRADTQIKSRGYRIELGEVESAVEKLEGIAECAILAIPTDGFAGNEICCAYALRPDVSRTAADVRMALAKEIPNYMLPTHWAVFPSLPKNDNGKIDRPLLRDQFARELRESITRSERMG